MGRVIERLHSCVKNDTIARIVPRGDGDGRAVHLKAYYTRIIIALSESERYDTRHKIRRRARDFKEVSARVTRLLSRLIYKYHV